jgi:NADH-quinone oxidoreductase subunit K
MTSLPLPLLAAVGVLGLLGLGLAGLLVTRNLIKVVVGLQVLVKGALLALVLAGRLSGQVQTGQSLALTVIVADTIVSVVALALAVQVRRQFGTLDLQALSTLRR